MKMASVSELSCSYTKTQTKSKQFWKLRRGCTPIMATMVKLAKIAAEIVDDLQTGVCYNGGCSWNWVLCDFGLYDWFLKLCGGNIGWLKIPAYSAILGGWKSLHTRQHFGSEHWLFGFFFPTYSTVSIDYLEFFLFFFILKCDFVRLQAVLDGWISVHTRQHLNS